MYMMITMITMRSIGPSYKGRSALLVTVMQKYGLRDSSTLIYMMITMRSIGPSYKGRSALLVTLVQKWQSWFFNINIIRYNDNHDGCGSSFGDITGYRHIFGFDYWKAFN